MRQKERSMSTAKRIPLRKCVGCGEMKNKKELIRVLKTTEEETKKEILLVDATGSKNGRGAYLCADMECFNKAKKNHGLERSLKTSIPPEIYEYLTEEMKKLGAR